ncbi:MAG TPA: dihydrofolate reductase family protein [Gaiellaceae bacterium]|nr:dihydrofolate reductase family protein [Gaiellaceae bacterium]
MGKVVLDISMSLDGFVAGSNPTLELPLGEGGERLHEWAVGLASWRQRHGLAGGDSNPSSEVVEEGLASTGAVVMGRRMFSGGIGPWEDDPNADGWWGEDPPFRVPVFVLTHHPREPLPKQGGTAFTFVTDGVESAVEEARRAAGDKDVAVGGGANVAQQTLSAGLLHEVQIHLAPVLLAAGTCLFENVPPGVQLELIRVVDAPTVTHLRYRVGSPESR